jgi:hypothetical protein
MEDGEGLAGGLVDGRSCSQPRTGTLGGYIRGHMLACSLGGSVGSRRLRGSDHCALTGLAAPALLGWGLRVTVCAWSVSVWVGPL